MKKSVFSIFAFVSLFSMNVCAETVIKAKTYKAKPRVSATYQQVAQDALRLEESRVCSELRTFAKQNILNDSVVFSALKKRKTKDVAKSMSKYATALAKENVADFVFYYPNSRFFIRINDKNYRGRMRVPTSLTQASSACFWERLPSQDVAYSMLIKLDGNQKGYLKISKKLTEMVSNFPDILSEFGRPRVYTALDKAGLKKMSWFKMRRKEPNKTPCAGWCTAEDLAFLTSIGSGRHLTRKMQKTLLSYAGSDTFKTLPDDTLLWDKINLFDIEDNRIAVIVYTLDTSKELYAKGPTAQDEAENSYIENFLYRFFE